VGGVAVYIGAGFLVAGGLVLAIWPLPVARILTTEDDGNRVPPAPGAARRTRIAGLLLIAFGVSLIWYGPAAFRGPPDVGAP
jgi:hypothetical protein